MRRFGSRQGCRARPKSGRSAKNREFSGRHYLKRIESDDDEFTGNEIYSAVRSMEILGQIVLNKYGSIEKECTERVIGVVCGLALKVVNACLSMGILEELGKLIDIERNEEDHCYKELNLRVLFGLSQKFRLELTIIIYIMIMKTAMVLGEIDLSEVFEKVRDKSSSPAYRLIFCFFILGATDSFNEKVCTVLIDAISKFRKEGNEIAERLLSIAVQRYLNTHTVDYKVRQRICGALRIDYIANRLT